MLYSGLNLEMRSTPPPLSTLSTLKLRLAWSIVGWDVKVEAIIIICVEIVQHTMMKART